MKPRRVRTYRYGILTTHVFSKGLSESTTTYRVVTASRLKAPRPLVVHDNLKTFTKYSECSVQNLKGLPQLSVLCALGHGTI